MIFSNNDFSEFHYQLNSAQSASFTAWKHWPPRCLLRWINMWQTTGFEVEDCRKRTNSILLAPATYKKWFSCIKKKKNLGFIDEFTLLFHTVLHMKYKILFYKTFPYLKCSAQDSKIKNHSVYIRDKLFFIDCVDC